MIRFLVLAACLPASVQAASASSCPWYPYDGYHWSACADGADALCTEGMEQSPIDFPYCKVIAAQPEITLDAGWTGSQTVTVSNNGHTFEVIPSATAKMTIDTESYTLAQCHFHYGSEHTVGGVQHDLCVHCVHTRDIVPEGGRTHAVLGRFYTTMEGSAADNAFFASFVDQLPASGDADVSVNGMMISDMTAGASMTQYWAYDGSLTTPGCAEIVQWRFLMDAGEVSTAQLDLIKTSIGSWRGTGNFRPPQPLHGRTVTGCEDASCSWYPYHADAWATCVSGAASLCTGGTQQSPIDFPHCDAMAAMPEVMMDAGWTGSQTVTVTNNGHTFEVVPSATAKMTIDTESYTLAQCHFHYGSEHTVGGVQHDLCVHCVHTRDVVPDGGRTHAVLGRFYTTDMGAAADNAFFASFVDQLPASGDADVSVDGMMMSDMMAGASMTQYWAYDGSLTTPGCAEIVQWRFLMGAGEVSSAQMDLIKTSIGSWEGSGNFRPPQPLMGRTVMGCVEYCEWYPYNTDNWASCTTGSSALCRDGVEQSPIDFADCGGDYATMPEINLDSAWGSSAAIAIVNNGHTFEVRPETTYKMMIESESYTLAQCHFHYGSEHTVGGAQHDLCVHCVHTRDVVPEGGRTHAVLGRFFSTNMGVAADNAFFGTFINELPAAPAEGADYTSSSFSGQVMLGDMMSGADMTQYWAYDGSLTTPGCAEIVQWRFLMGVGELSTSQMSLIKTSIGAWEGTGNFRPPQPLYGRLVLGCGAVEESCEWYPYNTTNWATCVSGADELCETGAEQSPIDFPSCSFGTQEMTAVELDAGWTSSQAIKVVNNGHAVEVQPGNTSKMTIGSESYTLAQCHFHWGSEHTVGGTQHDLCVHCVHTRDVVPSGGRTHAVLGRFYTTGTSSTNGFLTDLAGHLPAAPGEGASYTESDFTGPLVMSQMMAGASMTNYWAYDGSLTTPGCAEIVQWRFLMDVGVVGSAELTQLKTAIGSWENSGNFRPPQPLHSRAVQGCAAEETEGSNAWQARAATSAAAVMLALVHLP